MTSHIPLSSTRPALLMAAALLLPALIVGAPTAAAQPASRPGEMQPARGGGPGAGGGLGLGPGGGGGARGWFNREEHARALEFAQEHMPNLFREIEEAEPGSRRQRRMSFFAVERYRWAQRIERDEPGEYEAMLERLASHDEVFALIREFQTAPQEQRSELREQIRDRVHSMTIDLILERERRIENLKRMLGREETQLERDRENAQRLTNERVDRLLDEMGGVREPPPNMMRDDLSTAPGAPVIVEPSTAPTGRDR